MFKERAARYGVAVGGAGVILAIALIFFYLLYVVFPLFIPARLEFASQYLVADLGGGRTAYLAVDELGEVGARFSTEGKVSFFSTASGALRKEVQIKPPRGAAMSSFAAGDPGQGLIAYGTSDGHVIVARHRYKVWFPNNLRRIDPYVDYPLGEAPIPMDANGEPIVRLAVQNGEDQATIVAATQSGRLIATRFTKTVSFLDDSVTLERETTELSGGGTPPVRILLDQSQRRLYTANRSGELVYYDISRIDEPTVVQRLKVVPEGETVTALSFLSGTISLIVGTSTGKLTQWFPVRDENNNSVLTPIRSFPALPAAVVDIAHEYNRKGFFAADAAGHLAIYHATAHRELLRRQVVKDAVTRIAVSPRADAVLVEDAAGRLQRWIVHNEHPEISWSALWGKVWYESYSKPDYVWQSSAASNDFEPKFSLVPISFGTLKAAFYAMLFAIPLAVLGAIFTAHFMAPRMRRMVKPSIEIMEALPTVILGFLAGLWLAPYIERHLPGVFSLLIVMPFGVLLAAFLWHKLPKAMRHAVPEGWEAAILIPVIVLIAWFALALSPVLETWFFGGNMRQWLTNEAGIEFDQRNSIVVGIAMGFAVIPTIFSIAEDAIFSVPRHLTHGSLALGATPWQTLSRVVLLTASPGIFSAVMIGMGRAVGETMIVLMATGNTPVMDMSIFQGMRTLSANIAVEMPESEVNSTHFRVLFLAGLVLFGFTFIVNTGAELVRQRLRAKYSSL